MFEQSCSPKEVLLYQEVVENTQTLSHALTSVPTLPVHLQLLLKLIVDHLAEFSAEPGVFAMFSEQLKKTYFNILIKPERLGKYVSHTLTQ